MGSGCAPFPVNSQCEDMIPRGGHLILQIIGLLKIRIIAKDTFTNFNNGSIEFKVMLNDANKAVSDDLLSFDCSPITL